MLLGFNKNLENFQKQKAKKFKPIFFSWKILLVNNDRKIVIRVSVDKRITQRYFELFEFFINSLIKKSLSFSFLKIRRNPGYSV